MWGRHLSTTSVTMGAETTFYVGQLRSESPIFFMRNRPPLRPFVAEKCGMSASLRPVSVLSIGIFEYILRDKKNVILIAKTSLFGACVIPDFRRGRTLALCGRLRFNEAAFEMRPNYPSVREKFNQPDKVKTSRMPTKQADLTHVTIDNTKQTYYVPMSLQSS